MQDTWDGTWFRELKAGRGVKISRIERGEEKYSVFTFLYPKIGNKLEFGINNKKFLDFDYDFVFFNLCFDSDFEISKFWFWWYQNECKINLKLKIFAHLT